MFIRNYSRGTPRVLIRYRKFLDSVNTRSELMKDRFLKSEIGTSPSLTFVKYLLLHISEERYLTKDILDLYLEYISADAAMISRKFDSTQSGVSTMKGIFVSGDDTKEYMVPTNGIIGPEISILDSWEEWESVQPIKLVAHDSMELNVDFHKSQLEFNKMQPDYLVVAIDSKALLMKYIIYLRHFKIGMDNPNIDDFIIKHVLSFIYSDSIDIWITNCLMNTIDGIPIDGTMMSNVLSKSELDNGMMEITDLVNRYVAGNIEIGDLLATKFYHETSLGEMIFMYNNTYECLYGNRYIGMTLIKMTGLLRIFIVLLQMTVYRKKNTSDIRFIVKKLYTLKRKNYKSHVRDDSMIFEIETLIADIELLEDMV